MLGNLNFYKNTSDNFFGLMGRVTLILIPSSGIGIAIKPTLLRDFRSLLQWLESNNEMTWLWCNWINESRSLFYLDLILPDQILLFCSTRICTHPSSSLLLFSFSIQSTHLHTLENHNVTLYLYHLDCQVGSIQIKVTNIHNHSFLEPILVIINLYMPKQKNPSLADPTQ